MPQLDPGIKQIVRTENFRRELQHRDGIISAAARLDDVLVEGVGIAERQKQVVPGPAADVSVPEYRFGCGSGVVAS